MALCCVVVSPQYNNNTTPYMHTYGVVGMVWYCSNDQTLLLLLKILFVTLKLLLLQGPSFCGMSLYD